MIADFTQSQRTFTKAVLNYNSVTLCGLNAPVRKFSGSSMFTFVDNELFEKKDLTDSRKFELPFSAASIMPTLDLQFEPVLPKPKTYKLNKKVISRKLMSFFYSNLANEKLNFFTISFPAQTPDAVAFQVLNTSLTRLRKGYYIDEAANILLENFGQNKSLKWSQYVKSLQKHHILQELKNYIWISERQNNGTIHFHIVTSENINVLIFNYFVATSLFNSLQKNNLLNIIEHLNVTDYNGVDKSKIQNTKSSVNSVRKYLTKYITKSKSIFSRYCWHCSRSISALFTSQEYDISEVKNANFPISLNKKSDFSNISEFFTLLIFNDLNYKQIFRDLINVNNDIILHYFT